LSLSVRSPCFECRAGRGLGDMHESLGDYLHR
jgi:hypothetical protein